METKIGIELAYILIIIFSIMFLLIVKYFIDLLRHRKQQKIKKIIEGYYKNKEVKDVCIKMANIAKKIITNRTKT